MEEVSNNVKSYSKLAEFNGNRAYHAETGEELSREEDWSETEILYERAAVSFGAGGFLFFVFLSFSVGLYFFWPTRLANIALSIAFIGLLMFVTLSGIAFLTVFDL